MNAAMRTGHAQLTVAHGLPARFTAHVADREGARAWSFAPARASDARRGGLDVVETDLRSFDQRSIRFDGGLSLAVDERVYQCFATLLAPQGAAPVIVLVAMTRDDARPKNRLRAVRVAHFDTGTRRAFELWSAPLARAQDRPLVELLADHSAFRVQLANGTREAVVFDATGARSADAMLLDAFEPGPDRCALSKTLRARIDGRHVLFEDVLTGERWRSEPVVDEGDPRPALRAHGATRVLVSRGPKRDVSVVVDVESLRPVVCPRGGYVVSADDDGVVMAGRKSQPYTLFDPRTALSNTVAIGASALVAVAKQRLVFVRDGRFETVGRATGSVDDRQRAAMTAIAKIMVSDRGAVCAQDDSGLFCWWNDSIDRQCTSAAWPRDRAWSSRVLRWIDGQSTLLVQRSNARSSQVAALAWADGEPIERWSVDVERAAAVASDERAGVLVVESLATPTLIVYEREGGLVTKVARGALLEAPGFSQYERRRSPSFELRMHPDQVIERRSERGLELYRREGEAVVLCAVEWGMSPIGAGDGSVIATEIAGLAELVPQIALELGVLRPSAPALPHFEAQPERRMLCATVHRCSDVALPDTHRERRRSKGLWLAEREAFASLDEVTALAIAPNARWGAIGTRRGLVLRFAITPRDPSATHDPRA
jgi:hypothetical protein